MSDLVISLTSFTFGLHNFRNEAGQQVIDTAELSRLYTLQADTTTNRNTQKHTDLATELWQTKLNAAQEKIVLLERHIDTLENTLQRKQDHIARLLVTSDNLMLANEKKPKTWLKKIRKSLEAV